MTKRDILTEVMEELVKKGIIQEKDMQIAIGIAMGVFVGFTIVADPYVLLDE